MEYADYDTAYEGKIPKETLEPEYLSFFSVDGKLVDHAGEVIPIFTKVNLNQVFYGG